jgi:hypothetical protein
MGRGAEAGKADDSVDTDASTAPKMSGETGDAPSALPPRSKMARKESTDRGW